MLRLFDTHCHFETTDQNVIRAQLERAKAAGVEQILAVGGSPLLNESAAIACALASESENSTVHLLSSPSSLPRVLLAQGLDRDQVDIDPSRRRGTESAPYQDGERNNRGIAAVGEIGLDYHYHPETRGKQMELFAAQLEEARQRNLPVVIHTREADDDTLALLRETPSRGVIHCYTGTPEFAKKLLDLGFYISISGIVTFKSAANVRETALMIPDDRILIETDSPYLAPVPMRGKSNEPAFVVHTCEFLAKLRGVSAESFAELTFANGESMLSGTPLHDPAHSLRETVLR